MSNLLTKLNALLNRIFQAQSREVMSRVRLGGDVPDLSAWVKLTEEACKPLMLQMWQEGIIQAGAKLAARRGQRSTEVAMPVVVRPTEGMRRAEPGNDSIFGARIDEKVHQVRTASQLGFGSTKSQGKDEGVQHLQGIGDASAGLGFPSVRSSLHGVSIGVAVPALILKSKRWLVSKASGSKQVGLSFDLFNPRVIDAVNRTTYTFCRETLDTATMDLSKAMEELRQLMRDGLPQGDAVTLLAKKVRTIFADPYRAFRIATTEGSRAVHGGQMLLSAESGVNRHSWLASSDACDHCLELDGKVVRIGEPFHVDPKGGPYAITLHPPLHCFCFCSMVDELD
jgi:uncharacterized protein YoaH (UPF0181 family)